MRAHITSGGDITTQYVAEQLMRHQAEHQAEIVAARERE